MKKLIATFVLCLGLMLSAPVSTVAADSNGGSGWNTSTSWSWSGLQDWWSSFKLRVLSHFTSSGSQDTGSQVRPSTGSSVPELDMTAAGSAVVLLLGGVAYIASRRREQE